MKVRAIRHGLHNVLLILLSGQSVLPGITAQSLPFPVMTFNIKYDEPRDGQNSWPYRKAALVNLVEKHHPAFFGIQEGLHHQVAYIDSSLAQYRYIGVGRDDGKTEGEYSALFYDSTAFTVLTQKTFWLSETPDTVSYGWGAHFHRVCTYGLFKRTSTNEEVWVYNTHFDHQSVEARKQSAILIEHTIQQNLEDTPAPVILMGDFNATPDEEPIKILSAAFHDGLSISKTPLQGPAGTFNGFENKNSDHRIDYVFVQGFSVVRYAHLDAMRPDGGFISDHFPVLATVALQ